MRGTSRGRWRGSRRPAHSGGARLDPVLDLGFEPADDVAHNLPSARESTLTLEAPDRRATEARKGKHVSLTEEAISWILCCFGSCGHVGSPAGRRNLARKKASPAPGWKANLP